MLAVGLGQPAQAAGSKAAQGYNMVPAVNYAHLNRGINVDNIGMVTRYATYSSSDLATLQQIGINFVRMPIDVSCVLVGVPMDYKSGVSAAADVAKCVANLDFYIPQFEAAGFSVILSTFMGVSDVALGVPASNDILTRANVFLASRYAPQYDPSRLYLEPYNEPRYAAADWNNFVPQVIAAIRAYAPLNTIMIGPIQFNKPADLAYLNVAADKNVIYVMHEYSPSTLTSEGAGAHVNPAYLYPKPVASTDNTEWTTARLKADLQTGIDWAAAHKVHIILEEFGSTSLSDPTSRDNWIAAVKGFAVSNGVPWCFWAFDGRLYGLKPHPFGFDPELVKLLSTTSTTP